MSGAVEPIKRIPQPTTEQRLDLDRLTRHEETEEPAERLHIPTASGLVTPRATSAAITRSTSCSLISHAGLPANARNRSNTPVPYRS